MQGLFLKKYCVAIFCVIYYVQKGGIALHDRIKEARQALGLSQADFGSKVGIKQATVAGYESGTRTPLDAVITAICREFNVNEEWLRTGEGEMFKPKSRNEELFEFVASVVEGPPGDIRAKLLSVMARLSEEQWELLADMARKLSEETEKADPD